MPPLRECREDIPLLAGVILERYAGGAGPRLSAAATSVLASYNFPGNVRELENVLERAVALAEGDEILPDDLQLSPPSIVADSSTGGGKWPLQDYLDRIEREAILDALEQTRFNRTAAAKVLGISFRSLRYRMERLEVS